MGKTESGDTDTEGNKTGIYNGKDRCRKMQADKATCVDKRSDKRVTRSYGYKKLQHGNQGNDNETRDSIIRDK